MKMNMFNINFDYEHDTGMINKISSVFKLKHDLNMNGSSLFDASNEWHRQVISKSTHTTKNGQPIEIGRTHSFHIVL